MRYGMILAIGLWASGLFAQETNQAVVAAWQEMAAAMSEQDQEKMKGLFAESFSFTSTDQVTISNAEELKAYYDEMLGGDAPPVQALKVTAGEVEQVREVDEGTVLLRALTAEAYDLSTGESFTFDATWTATLVQENGAWKFATLHGGIHYFNNPVMKKYADSNTSTGVIAGFVGMLMGFVFSLVAFVQRKKPK